MARVALSLILPLAACLLGGASAYADEPQSTSATYDAWTLRCATPPPVPPPADATKPAPPATPGVKQCEVVEAIQIQGQPQPLVQIAIGAPQTNGPTLLVVQVPIASWLPTGVSLKISDKVSVALIFKRCLPGACLADTELTDATRDAMRSQASDGSVTFRIAPDQDTTVPISFKGLSAALDALRTATK